MLYWINKESVNKHFGKGGQRREVFNGIHKKVKFTKRKTKFMERKGKL
jgi:hypothetical protein